MKANDDFLTANGPLALASRMRRLADEILDEVTDVYAALDFDLNARFFPLLGLLASGTPIGITDAAKQLGMTHPAVSQMASELRSREYILEVADKQDERRRLMALSEKGKILIRELAPIWEAVRLEAADLLRSSEVDFLSALSRLEENLHERKFSKRIVRRMKSGAASAITISPWKSQFKDAFHDLNREWIDRYFGSEEKDIHVLKNPEEKILAKGGMVFFALINGRPVGTGALIKLPKNRFEVVKMAVSRAYRGAGIGEKLLTYMTEWARKQGSKILELETNSQLIGAIKLYNRLGFIQKAHPKGKSDYDRVDVYMEMEL